MRHAYVRVSTDKQTSENQKFEILKFANEKHWKINQWTEEVITGTRKKTEGKFGKLFKKLQKGDSLVVTELSRLGRNLMEIMSILHDCMEREIYVYTVKERYELGNNINSKVLAFAFGLSAEIERNLISQRTKEALARKRAEGVILGRPKGRKSSKLKLTDKEDKIRELIDKRVSYSAIGRIFKVHRLTVASYVKNNILPERAS